MSISTDRYHPFPIFDTVGDPHTVNLVVASDRPIKTLFSASSRYPVPLAIPFIHIVVELAPPLETVLIG